MERNTISTLDETGMRSAVTEALRHYHDPARLARNPLLQSGVLRRETGADTIRPGPYELRTVLRRICREHLKTGPRTLPAPERTLTLAYFEPVGKQFAAADVLNVSERTFRRYLRDAERRLADLLWLMESGWWRT